MTRRTITLTFVSFVAGGVFASLLMYAFVASGHAAGVGVGLTAPRDRSEGVETSTRLWEVVQASAQLSGNVPDRTLPDDASGLMQELALQGLVVWDPVEAWSGSERRPTDEAPFYIIASAEDLLSDSRKPFLYGHPEHHPGLGVLVAYTDGHVSTFTYREFAALMTSTDAR